jgi:hypothetical protein
LSIPQLEVEGVGLESGTPAAAKPRAAFPILVSGVMIGVMIAGGSVYWWLDEHHLLATIQNGAPATRPPVETTTIPVPPPLSVVPATATDVPKETGSSESRMPPSTNVASVALPAPPASQPPASNEPITAPVTPFEKWQQQHTAEFDQAYPGLRIWHDSAARGTIKDVAPLVSGLHPTAFRNPREHRALLKWLVIDPPRDAEVRRSVFNTLIRLSPPAECLELFEPLCEFHASNAEDARRAADVMLGLFADKLSPEAKRRLQAVVDSTDSPPNEAKK